MKHRNASQAINAERILQPQRAAADRIMLGEHGNKRVADGQAKPLYVLHQTPWNRVIRDGGGTQEIADDESVAVKDDLVRQHAEKGEAAEREDLAD